MSYNSVDELKFSLMNCGVTVNFGCVSKGGEGSLLPEEVESFRNCAVSVMRQGAAARGLARVLLAQRGYDRFPLPRRLGYAPVWPLHIVGSLSHCEDYAAAAVASASHVSGLGIDIEPALALPDDIFDLIATPGERRSFLENNVRRRMLFCAKEAAFKAAYAADEIPIEFCNIEIGNDFDVAVTCYGRKILIKMAAEKYITTVGLIIKN